MLLNPMIVFINNLRAMRLQLRLHTALCHEQEILFSRLLLLLPRSFRQLAISESSDWNAGMIPDMLTKNHFFMIYCSCICVKEQR